MKTTPTMDWQQVALNGGPPCFAQLEDEEGYFCGRAERWEGHDGEHAFVSLESYVAQREAEVRAEEKDRHHDYAVTSSGPRDPRDPCYCKCHTQVTVRQESCVHCNSYLAYPPVRPTTAGDAATDAARIVAQRQRDIFPNLLSADAITAVILQTLRAMDGFCWHCGVVLALAQKPCCENCPHECDVEGCDAMGCRHSEPQEGS